MGIFSIFEKNKPNNKVSAYIENTRKFKDIIDKQYLETPGIFDNIGGYIAKSRGITLSRDESKAIQLLFGNKMEHCRFFPEELSVDMICTLYNIPESRGTIIVEIAKSTYP